VGAGFAVSLQKALLEMPLDRSLAEHEAFLPKLGSHGQVSGSATACVGSITSLYRRPETEILESSSSKQTDKTK
jgi:hypothetical protein